MFWPADCFFLSSFSHLRWGLESWSSLFKPVKTTSSNLYNHFNFVENFIRGTLLCWSQPAALLTQSLLVQPCQIVIALLGKVARGDTTLVSPFYVLLAQDKLTWTQKEPQPHQSLSVCGLRLISLSSSLAKQTLLRAWRLAESSSIWWKCTRCTFPFCLPAFPLCYSPVLLWMVLTVVVVRGGDEERSEMHSSSCEQPFSMALT